ncbi:MAG: type II toxin-antitoxin system VapC family toxin [Gemmatimonadota bacterium]
MRFLLDTCILSDAARPTRFPKLVAWLNAQVEDDLAISALTVGELRYGIQRLAAGRKREKLKDWLDAGLVPQFAGRVLPADIAVAENWALLRASGDEMGRPLPLIDGMLLATAQAHGLTFVTRNLSDVENRGVRVQSPY